MKTHTGLYFVLLCLVCCLAACDYDEDDYISKYCPGSCTVIKGRISDQNGAPVAGVTLRARWLDSGYLRPTFTREKAIATTDANGNYELRFLVRDQELTKGYIELESEAGLESYLSCRGFSHWSSYEMARDTTIIQNYAVAQAASLRLFISSEEEIQPRDLIFTTVKYKLNASDADSCVYTYSSRNGYSSYRFPVPASVPVVLHTETLKAGSRSTQKDTLVLEADETREYQLSF